jgi:hypothetical protein
MKGDRTSNPNNQLNRPDWAETQWWAQEDFAGGAVCVGA